MTTAPYEEETEPERSPTPGASVAAANGLKRFTYVSAVMLHVYERR